MITEAMVRKNQSLSNLTVERFTEAAESVFRTNSRAQMGQVPITHTL
jgi:hypothetical protein